MVCEKEGIKKLYMKNIIIRMPNFIGDSINTLPAIDLLKQEYPGQR